MVSSILTESLGVAFFYNLSYELQSGFQTRQSTETALIMKTDAVVGHAFIEVHKAFDVICYGLLLKELFIYSPSNNCVASFQSCP